MATPPLTMKAGIAVIGPDPLKGTAEHTKGDPSANAARGSLVMFSVALDDLLKGANIGRRSLGSNECHAMSGIESGGALEGRWLRFGLGGLV